MIINQKYKRPILSFGLGELTKTIALGDSVTFYQNQVYNTDVFNHIYLGLNQNMYAVTITPVSAGTLTIQSTIEKKDGSIIVPSNKITLTIV